MSALKVIYENLKINYHYKTEFVMKIHKEGYRLIPLVLGLLIALNFVVFITGIKVLFVAVLLPSMVLAVLTVRFFRDPQVKKDSAPREVYSVADGRVVVIEPTFEKEYFKDKRIQVSVFMSVFNVHINHVPVDGEVVYQQYHPGKFLAANLPKSSELNERSTTVIRTANGTEILIRQIAGLLARRIVTYKKPGDKVSVKDQLGFIKFGSRVDIFFPVGTEIPAQLNQEVKGGLTLLGKLPE
jgi:phosphatidylserine decarboxylase